MSIRSRYALIPVLVAAFAATLLSGCSGNFAPGSVEPLQTHIGTIQGAVHGGQSPISGAHIYLYAASTSGYQTAATSLLSSSGDNVFEDGSGNYYVTTDANGNFSLSGDYTCTQGQEVYVAALGGNPGFPTAVYNTAIVQLAALGQCPSGGSLASQVPYVVINEVTTVAFAYSVAGFATNPTTPYLYVSSDAGGATALANAFANAGNIVNLQWGQAPTAANGNANSVAPQAKLYTLGNILSACVNTSSPTSSGCLSLFAAATTSNGTEATDEASAIFNIAQNQAMMNSKTVSATSQSQNVQALYNVMGDATPFYPYLTSAPTDWTLPVIYNNVISLPSTGGTTITSGPYNLVFDADGNAWIGDRAKGVVEIGPLGAVKDFSNSTYGFGMVKGVAVSPQDGTIWVTDYENQDVYVMDPNGANVATLTTDVAKHGPILTAFAINPASTANYLAYEADESNASIVVYNADFDSGAATYDFQKYENNTNYTDVTTPGWISVDNSGTVWIPSTDTANIAGLAVEDNKGTMRYTSSEPQPFGITFPGSYTTAADGNGNIWVATDSGTPTLYESNAGAQSGEYTGGGMNDPYKLVVDGTNVVWIANDGANTVSAFPTTGTSAGNPLSSDGFSTDVQAITTTGTYALASTAVTVASAAGINDGYSVSGTGIPAGTTVSNITGTTITLSQITTAAENGVTLSFTPTGAVVIGVDPSGNVWTGNADESVTQLLGLGSPTAAPLYGGATTITTNPTTGRNVTTVSKGNIGTRP